ncbi:CBS domain-containing protein [Loktanella ponticola]|uniref:CBS domain-containing protein n=1 Tax=Yoonia ponticola TaxID=1524255 RepID=A0A7W9BJZ4_9RHOB|nr:CBS domain-containing protein [Yoonia ponticola]MBB5721726.1 CBS domain-containing protein [Yoonia ponticola]
MLVSKILETKPEGGVISVKPNSTVGDATKVLSDKRIGTLVVSTDGDTLEGILSERDIVRALGVAGPSCLDQKVHELMTAKIITCEPTEQADSVLAKMTEGRFRHMPVMVDGKMVGLISIGDAVKARLAELSMEKDALQGMIMGH